MFHPVGQTKYIVMLAKEGGTEIVNFMTHGTGFLIQGGGHVSHYSENVFCHLCLHQYTAH